MVAEEVTFFKALCWFVDTAFTQQCFNKNVSCLGKTKISIESGSFPSAQSSFFFVDPNVYRLHSYET